MTSPASTYLGNVRTRTQLHVSLSRKLCLYQHYTILSHLVIFLLPENKLPHCQQGTPYVQRNFNTEILKFSAHTTLCTFVHRTLEAGIPSFWVYHLMIWSAADVIIIEINYRINVMHLHHLKAILPSPLPSLWKSCLPWNGSLVPKRLGTAALKDMCSCPVCWIFWNFPSRGEPLENICEIAYSYLHEGTAIS